MKIQFELDRNSCRTIVKFEEANGILISMLEVRKRMLGRDFSRFRTLVES